MQVMIAKCAYQGGSGDEHKAERFSADAIASSGAAKGGSDLHQIATARIVDAVQCLLRPDYSSAVSRLLDIILPNVDEEAGAKFLSELSTVNDIAFYIVLSALGSRDRNSLKEYVLKHANFVTLT